MIEASEQTWSWQRLWLVAATIFTAQLGVIVLMAEHPRATLPAARGEATLRLAAEPIGQEQLFKYYFAGDPTLFMCASRHGFSGKAWLHTAAWDYEVPDLTEKPLFLELNTNLLPNGGAELARPPSDIPFQLAEEAGAQIPAEKPEELPPMAPVESRFHMDGPLAQRMTAEPGELPVWATNSLITNSIVQLAVNSDGQVVSARLEERSGLTKADTQALEIANRMRFTAAGGGRETLTWGRAVFDWRSVAAPEASTNAPTSQ